MAASLSELALEFPNDIASTFSDAAAGASLLHQAAAMSMMVEDEAGQAEFGKRADEWAGLFLGRADEGDAFACQCILSAYKAWCTVSKRQDTAVRMIAEKFIYQAVDESQMSMLLQEFEKATSKPPAGTVEISQVPEPANSPDGEEDEGDTPSNVKKIRAEIGVIGTKLGRLFPNYELKFAYLPSGLVSDKDEYGVLWVPLETQKMPSGAKAKKKPSPAQKKVAPPENPKPVSAFFFSLTTGITSVVKMNDVNTDAFSWYWPMDNSNAAEDDQVEAWGKVYNDFSGDLVQSIVDSFEVLRTNLNRTIKKTDPGDGEPDQAPPSSKPIVSTPASPADTVKPNPEMADLLKELGSEDLKKGDFDTWLREAVEPNPDENLSGKEAVKNLRFFAKLCVLLSFRVSKQDFIEELDLAFENMSMGMLQYILTVLGGTSPAGAKKKVTILDEIKKQDFSTINLRLKNPVPAFKSGNPFDLEESGSDNEPPPMF